MDAVCVHAAQRAGIHGDRWRSTFARDGCHAAISTDPVCAQRHIKIFGMDACVDFGCARDD